MGAERSICCTIMLCQMTAILSGVAIMYLSVIVVFPSKEELDLNIIDNPIMCTTTEAINLAAGGVKVDCHWSTCGEWCLSQAKSPCWHIYTMPRYIGAAVELQDCRVLANKSCSAIDPEKTQKLMCRKGECKELNGLYNCSKVDENPCTDISLGFSCKNGHLNRTVSTKCNEDKCSRRLNGIYSCISGSCARMERIADYRDCDRKCEDLEIDKGNAVLVSQKILYTLQCNSVNSTGNNSLNDLNTNERWIQNKADILMLFCSYVQSSGGTENVYFSLNDCFNASLQKRSELVNVKGYMNLTSFINNIPRKATDWILEPEDTLRYWNDTKLRINSEGCSNTLSQVCKAFFKTHDTDGRDGKIPDRYPCFYSNKNKTFVFGTYNPDETYFMFLITSILPACLFIFSCSCLYFCSKSVGVDEIGHLKVILPGSKGKGPEPGHSMIEMDL